MNNTPISELPHKTARQIGGNFGVAVIIPGVPFANASGLATEVLANPWIANRERKFATSTMARAKLHHLAESHLTAVTCPPPAASQWRAGRHRDGDDVIAITPSDDTAPRNDRADLSDLATQDRRSPPRFDIYQE